MGTMGYSAIVESMRRGFRSQKILSVENRKIQLQNLKNLILENADQLTEAIRCDIKRSKAEGYCYEVQFVLNEVNSAINDVQQWMKPQPVARTLLQVMDKAYILKDPLGVVLIISPWNYPVNLLLGPLVGALAAGNCVILKPSEISKHTEKLMTELIPKYFEPDVVRLITGGVQETTELLKERFDHIFYTGAPLVGKIIMQAAAKHLTPVTLELGGKCPAIIDDNCDMVVAAKRIAWGKFMSCGQTCLAPDYVICSSKSKPMIIEAINKAIKELYGDNPQEAPDYSRIISRNHFERLEPLLQCGTIVLGGKTNKSDLYIEPTVLDNINATDEIMTQEIFGPILPIITENDIDKAIEFVNNGEKPLGLYIFSKNEANIKKVLHLTSSGGVTVNDTILHLALDTLPFGGVGHSGMGRYRGKYSFDTFTHEKSVLQRKLRGEKILWMRYPPYDDQKFYWAKKMSEKVKLPQICFLAYVPLFLVGLLLGYLIRFAT